MENDHLLYEGKAKRVFEVNDKPDQLRLEFKDALTAFNAQKKGEFSGKGQLNRNIASLIFRFLKKRGIESHWVGDQGDREMFVKRLEMIPLEVVVRNRIAGSLAKKFQLEEGGSLEFPLVELFYKNDGLGDPFISDEQALMLKAARDTQQLKTLKNLALKINEHLRELMDAVGIDLVDFKLEFGWDAQGEALLGDEITPDSCRLWDKETGEKMDKDRFRRDLGQVEENYQKVLSLLKEYWEPKL